MKKQASGKETVKADVTGKPGGMVNRFVSFSAGIGCTSLIALIGAFTAIKLFPDFFGSMGERNRMMLKILTGLMAVAAGRLVYGIVRSD